jgi:hypothetical protein
MNITVVEGNLLDQEVEVIVNAWKRNIIPWWLLLPQGVSGAIKKRGGTGPFKELRKHGPIPLGSAVLTSAGRLVYQTYNGYVMSQFKKMQADLRNQGQVKWKHVMHLIRLLLSGITVLRERFVPVQVGDHREMLLRIKSGAVSWNEVETWRRDLHKQFDRAFEETMLPEKPDYHRANDYLVKARRLAMSEELP